MFLNIICLDLINYLEFVYGVYATLLVYFIMICAFMSYIFIWFIYAFALVWCAFGLVLALSSFIRRVRVPGDLSQFSYMLAWCQGIMNSTGYDHVP